MFGKNYERRRTDGTWEPLETLAGLNVGDVVRLNGANPVTVSTLKRDGDKTDFVAHRVEEPKETDEHIVLMHFDGADGEFPPDAFPLPEQPAFKGPSRPPVDLDFPEPPRVETPAEPTPAKKSSSDLIRDALARGAERTVDEIIAFFADAGKAVKADTVKWTLGQMSKAGEVERTETGTWKLVAA